MEKIILESEARYRSVVERAGDGITILQDQSRLVLVMKEGKSYVDRL